jgi:excinuclease ABC subunit A
MRQFLVEAVADAMGELKEVGDDEDRLDRAVETLGGEITEGLDKIKRLVVVDQKPIGRKPRSNLATYTGLFDHVRKLFAATKQVHLVIASRCSTRMSVVSISQVS